VKAHDHEEQLREFFKHHPVDNPRYLKRYVKEHPANKMAWYLLGKEYAAQGKHGKALYCFTQAGEIYEAFEKQEAPVIADKADRNRQPEESLQRKSNKRFRLIVWLRRLTAAAVVVLLMAYSPVPDKPSATIDAPKAIPADQLKQTKVYYMTQEKTKENIGAALQEIVVKEAIDSYSILVQGEPTADRRWIRWLKPPNVLLSVEGKADASELHIQYHDASSCDCRPTEPVKARSILEPWMSQQEQELILRSALAAFYRKNSRLPDDVQELNRPYPDNVLPGLTPFMTEKYRQEKAALDANALAMAINGGERPGPASGQPYLTKPLTEPLQIIVDKENHRLALVSGNIIIRNYPVGLGGDKTPEGEFAITEKVRNPNGKSDGEFGSRGMTLSDTLYAIHGTNKPSSIGLDQSLGCVRMLKEDVEELFDMVPLGTKVTIGRGMLPDEIERSGHPFQMPLFSEETNPGKIYKWLD
jgi:lipoprotein-anchoring transpeptidase ErfK/SrfK